MAEFREIAREIPLLENERAATSLWGELCRPSLSLATDSLQIRCHLSAVWLLARCTFIAKCFQTRCHMLSDSLQIRCKFVAKQMQVTRTGCQMYIARLHTSRASPRDPLFQF